MISSGWLSVLLTILTLSAMTNAWSHHVRTAGCRQLSQLSMIGGLFQADKKSQPTLPRNVKDAVTACRSSVQEALGQRLSRMAIEFPVGTKFGVEAVPDNKKTSTDTAAPTRDDFLRSDRELARLFVDMFQPVGGENIAVVFADMEQAEAASNKWRSDATAQCRISSLDGKKKRKAAAKKKTKGFAAKLAAEIGDDDESGPFRLTENTEVALFVAPSTAKELATIERICHDVGMGTLVILLNARIGTIDSFPTPTAETLYKQGFESVFCLSAADQAAAPNCLLYRAFPGPWSLARKPRVGQPKPLLTMDARPTVEEYRAAHEAAQLSDLEEGVENAIENMASWFR